MGWQKDPQESPEDFWKQLETLRGEVKNHLFSPARSGAIAVVPVKSDEVHDALLRILEKWRRDLAPERGELSETIILSPQGVQREPPAPPPTAKDRGEMVPEAVILSGEKDRARGRKVEESVPETMILSCGEAAPKPAPSPGPAILREMGKEKVPASKEAEEGGIGRKKEQPEDDLLSETVILGPEKIRELNKRLSKKER